MGKLVAARLVFDRVLGRGGVYHGWSLDGGASMSPAQEVRSSRRGSRRGTAATTTSVLLKLIMMPLPFVATLSVCVSQLCMLLQKQLLFPGVPLGLGCSCCFPGVPLGFRIADAVAASRGSAGVADAVAVCSVLSGR